MSDASRGMPRIGAWPALVLAMLVSAAVLGGCSESGAEPGEGEAGAQPAQAEATASVPDAQTADDTSFSPEGAEVALGNAPPRRGPALTGKGEEQWILELEVTNTGDEPLDGLNYSVQLVKGKGQGEPFAVHAGEIHFNPPIAPQGKGHWTARMRVSEGQPEDASAVRLRWTGGERLVRKPSDEPVWKPLDPNNLPPPRTVTLDGKGNVAEN